MYAKLMSATAVVLASSGLVAAQTHSSCNPVAGQSCPADPAVGGTVTIDFTKGASDFFEVAAGTEMKYDHEKGAAFVIQSEGQAPTITSKKYIFFGRVDVTVMCSNGVGIVTSSVLQSDDLDEIDWEWLGGDTVEVQTNYFSKGNTSTYNRGGFSKVANPQTTWHTYSIDWTPEKLDWIIDGTVVRTLPYNGNQYPQTPMQIKIGTWVGGAKGAPQGTVQWAGGYANFADAPFTAYYKSVTVTDYSNGVKGATSYSYGDSSGTYSSIKVSTKPYSGSSNVTSSASSNSTSSASGSSSTLHPNSTATGTGGSGSGSGSGSSTTATGAVKTTGPAGSAGTATAANLLAIGAALVLGYLL